MDPDEFEDYLDSLPPGERQQAMADFGLMNTNTMPSTFGGTGFGGGIMSPELTPQSYDLGMMNQIPIAMDYRGNPEPFGQDQIRDLYNGLQDFGAISLDPALAMFGGEGAFAPQTFAPSTIPVGDPLDMAGSRYVQGLAQAKSGYESYLARKIINGMTPGAAVADMWAKINAADSPEAPPEVVAQAADLKASLPPNTSSMDSAAAGMPSAPEMGDLTSPEGRAASINLDALTAKADDLYERLTSDPQAGYTDPQTGLQYAAAYQQPSEMAEKFAEYGLPTPFEEYTDPQWLPPVNQETMDARMAREQAGQQRVNRTTNALDTARSNYNLQEKAWADTEDDRANQLDFGPLPTEPLPPEGQHQFGGVNPDVERSNIYGSLMSSGATEPNISDQLVVPEDEQAAYDASHEAWQAEMDFREEQARNAGTDNPYIAKQGNKIIDTYDFGELDADEQDLAAGVLESVYGAAGHPVEVGESGSNWESGYGDAYHNAYEAQQNAQDWAEQQYQMTSPDEIAGAEALMQGYALQRQGRTPMNDVLMQRSLGRSTLSPYLGGGGLGYLGG